MIILGLNAFHADSSAALVRDGKLIAAAEEERFRRIKHWAGFPSQAIAYCLSEAGMQLSDVDHIAFNQDSRANLLRKIAYFLMKRPNINLVLRRLRNRRARGRAPGAAGASFPGQTVRAAIPPCRTSSGAPILGISRLAVRSGGRSFGRWLRRFLERGLGHRRRDPKSHTHGRVYFPHSLGIFYQALTQYLGFPHYGDEYKVMGLAPYGRPSLVDAMRKIVRLLPGGGVRARSEILPPSSGGHPLSMGGWISRIRRLVFARAGGSPWAAALAERATRRPPSRHRSLCAGDV